MSVEEGFDTYIRIKARKLARQYPGFLADDLAQEGAIAAWRAARTSRTVGVVQRRAWVRQNIRWAMQQYLRRTIYKRNSTERRTPRCEGLEAAMEIRDPRPGPESLAIRTEKADRMRASMKRLSPARRAIVHWVFYAEMTGAEVASRLGISRQRVHAQLRAALGQLARWMEETDGKANKQRTK